MVQDGGVQPQVWERLDVSAWQVVDVEPAGSTQNLWLADPESTTGTLWLHKDTVTPTTTGIEQGEDWSEIVSSQVAMTLGVPCAATRLCLREGRRGSLSKSVRPADADLVEGQVVLATSAPLVTFHTSRDVQAQIRHGQA